MPDHDYAAPAYRAYIPTIRKHLMTVKEPVYLRKHQLHPKLGMYHEQMEAWLEKEAPLLRKQRRSAHHLYEYLMHNNRGNNRGSHSRRCSGHAYSTISL